MTTFPTLYPDSITFDHGLPQVSEYAAFGVGPIRFRNSNLVNSQVFTLEYQNIQQSSVDLIRDHYIQNQGTAGSFAVPSSIFGGINLLDANSRYKYAETPTEQHFGVYFSLSVTLQALEGVDTLSILNGGSATLPSEESFSSIAFEGTAPFILNGSSSVLATMTLNAS